MVVLESCPTPHPTAFLMLYRLVYNLCSHFNELINFGLTCLLTGYSFEHTPTKENCRGELLYIDNNMNYIEQDDLEAI